MTVYNWWFALLAKMKDEEIKSSKIHTRYLKAFYKALSAEAKRRRNRCIPRRALIALPQSSWRKLFESRDDQSMITLTGLDHQIFGEACESFAWYFDNYSPFIKEKDGLIVLKTSKRGEKRKIRPEDCLALVLAWTRTRGSLFCLQLIFRLTYTNLSMYLRFGKRIFVECFQNDDRAAIRIPTAQKIDEYISAIASRHGALKKERVWATMDGLKLYLQCAGNSDEQEKYYNGWTHDHYTTSVIVFCPYGTIPIAFFNVPGSIHDSQVADFGNIYKKLEEVFEETGGKCTVDSAFCLKNQKFLIKSSQDPLTAKGNTEQEVKANIQVQLDSTSMRQSAEWGMRNVQSSFPRIKDRFVFEERGDRRLTLKMIMLLNNFCARTVGINQIRNVYMPYLNRDANDTFLEPHYFNY